jgi:hypothetical protein
MVAQAITIICTSATMSVDRKDYNINNKKIKNDHAFIHIK